VAIAFFPIILNNLIIKTIPITNQKNLDPELLVNVWEIDPCFSQEVAYYTLCQVKDLDQILATATLSPEDYLLEIIEHN
jgi:hypothetical protein